jgi:hypothetical protein
MIEYIPDNFFIAHWFVDQPSDAYRKMAGVANMNWIAAIWRNPNGLYELQYRFAYFDNRERHVRSSWFRATSKGGQNIQQQVAAVDYIAKRTSKQNGNSKWERVDLNMPGDEAFLILIRKPWMRIIATEAEMN